MNEEKQEPATVESEVTEEATSADQEEKKEEEQLTQLEAELAEMKNLYFKALADRENTRERLSKEVETIKKYRAQSFLVEFLPAFDNLTRALEDDSEDYQKLKAGVEMTVNQLKQILSKEGVEEIEALGQEFDPTYHHALITEAQEGVAANQVIEVLQTGYKLKDRVLRPTLVKVSE